MTTARRSPRSSAQIVNAPQVGPAVDPVPAPATPAPAATVVLLRPGRESDEPSQGRFTEPEVLLIQRPATMAFGPGIHVFPGGRVDPGDSDPATVARSARSAPDASRVLGGHLSEADAVAIHVAALRELEEEVGVALVGESESSGSGFSDAERLLRTDLLVPIAHWTTPAFMARRFSTWFFVADLPPDRPLSFAADEVHSHRWLTPTAALEAMASGELEMWVPTTSVLERLIEAEATTATDVAKRIRFERLSPPAVVHDDEDRLVLETSEAGGLPGRRCRTTLLGRRDVVIVDPGDASDGAIEAIRAAVERRNGAVRAIVLTAPDPDHAAGAEALAIPLEVPILAAPGAGRHLPYEIHEVADGDPLPSDVDVRVRLGGRATLSLELARSAGE